MEIRKISFALLILSSIVMANIFLLKPATFRQVEIEIEHKVAFNLTLNANIDLTQF